MSYTSSPNGLFSYTISGTSDATEISVIQSAFDKWDSLLTVPDRFLDTGETKYTITVTYSVADLDTGILGSAALQTYRYVTSNTYGNMMPLTGFIQLNTDYTAAMLADVRTSGKTRYYYVVLHEIGHILGIGQFWSTSYSAPLSTYTEDSTTKYYYTGTNAVEQYKSYLTNPEKNLVLGIPVEDEGGTGTKNVHPEEGLETGVSTDDRYINGVFHPGLNTELMTGWMDGTPDDTPLSRITLGFLADQGYNVNYNDAESFSIIYTNMSYNFDTLRNSGQTDEQIQAAYPNALLDASLGYFNNANKFKESYVKDLLDVSGNMKVYPGYKTLVESSVEDGSHNIAGTLHTNTLNVKPRNVVTSDLSYNNTYTAIDSVARPSYDYDFRQTVTASSNTTDMTDYISNSPVSYSGSVSFSSSTGATVSTNAYLVFSPTISGPAFSIEYYYTSNGTSSGATNWRFILGLYDNTTNFNGFHWQQRGSGDSKNQWTLFQNTGSNTYTNIDRQEYNSTMHQASGTTYHDVIVMDGTNITVYRNGNVAHSAAAFSYTESQFPTGTMTYSTIGNHHASVSVNDNNYTATHNQTHLTTVHAYRLWNNHALTSTEVTTLYANRTQSNLFQQTSFLVYSTLPDLVDLSLNRLSVNEDVSFNKHVTIGGNLTVKGAFKLPDNSLETTDFSDYEANSSSVGPNEFNFNNSNIFSALDLSGLDIYVAGETTVNANDFKIEGNVYANSIINDEKDNPIIEDNTLINRLDLSNNPFKVKKTYAAANYAAIPEDQDSTLIIPQYNWDFRVASSTSITDSIGGLTATYANGATSTVSDGISLAGGTINGNGHHVDLQDFVIGLDYSFEVYLKFGPSADSYERVFDFGDGQSSDNIILQRSGTTSSLWFGAYTGANKDVEMITGTIVSEALTHIVGVFGSDGYLKLYQDGTLLGTSTTTTTTPTKARTNNYIGRTNWTNNNDLDGNIYYFRVYNTTLTQNDVTSLYTNRDNTNVTGGLTSSSVPYISDTGKNMAFTNFNAYGSYNTAFSNNYGTSFVDMATRVGGTTGSKGLLNLLVTDNQKYMYGINPSRGIVKSTNYGHEFTDVSMVSLPDSDLSFNITNSNDQVFDLSHADTICSSSDGKHTYIAGPHTEIPAPSYDYDFKNSGSVVDNISSNGGTLQGNASIGTDGLTLDGTGDRFEMNSTNFTWGGTNTMEIYVKLTTQTQSGVNLGIMGFGIDNANSGGAYFILQTGTAQTHYAFYQRDDANATQGDVTTTSINYNSFDHHVLVFDPTSGIKYYINGILAVDTNAAYTSTSQTRSNYEYRVGAPPYDDATNGIAGIFSHVRIWNNVAFTSEQVTTLYNNRDSNTNMWYTTDVSPSTSYFLIKSSDYGNNFVFDISENQIGVMKKENASLNDTSVRHLSCSSDGKYVVANINCVTKANYLMNDLTGTSHPVLSTDYGKNWQLLNSHHFNEYQVLENLDLSFNQNKLKMDCVGVKISKTGRYIACALGSQELTNKMLFYLSSDYGKSFDFKSILNNDNTTFGKQINLSPNAEHIATFSTHQGSKVNISTDYGENWKEVDLTLNGLTANTSAKSYVSGNLQYLAHNSKESITASLGGVNITHDFDFRVASTTGITEKVSQATMTYSNGAYSTVSNGLILDGTNDYAEGDGFDVNFSGAASFEFYIKFNNTSASETIFSLHDSTFTDGFSLIYNYNTYVETGSYSGNSTIYRPTLTNAQFINSTDFDPRYNHLNNWLNGGSLTHCVIVYNSTTGWSAYKNGSLHSSYTTFQSTYYDSVTPTAPNATNVSRKLTIGTTNTSKSVYASMELAYFRVYDSELSATQVSTLYSNRNTASTATIDFSSRSHGTNNTFITPYVKTCYTHMVKDNANILNGDASANTDITYSGGVLTASDYRLKSNIQTLSGETLDNLRPVKFNFTHNNHKTFGLIAHELQEEYPYLVDGEKDGANYQTVNYTGLLGLCAHELQQIKKGLEEYD